MENIEYFRTVRLDLTISSAFLFGPRMTGKSHLLRQLKSAAYFDLLDPEVELSLRQSPRKFWEQIQNLPNGSLIVLDEVQRIPTLLDYVQMGIDRLNQKFILSGSSARKLKRGSANLLGGRALDLKLHPLSTVELGESFSIEIALQFGTLPRIYMLAQQGYKEEAIKILRSYYSVYIKEEVQAEALVRNLGAFQRFLDVAAQSNGTIIEYSNISKDCQVPDNTVKEYFGILEDTLIGGFLYPWHPSERKKGRPKFYFFDCGVIRAIQNRLIDPPGSRERGILFETFMIRELHRLRDNLGKEHKFSFWRDRDHEVDILVLNSKGIALAIECKSSEGDFSLKSLKAFKKKLPNVPVIVASLCDDRPRKLEEDIEILPWKDALSRYLDM